MVTRDGTGLIIRPALPALTTNLNLYILYGQSNSTGTSSQQLFNPSDPTMGGGNCFGRDGLYTRDGTTLVWTDLTYAPAVLDFTPLTTTQLQEPCRAYGKEVASFEIARVLNAAQIALDGKRHRQAWASFGHTAYTLAHLIKTENAYTNLINGVTEMVADATALGLTAVVKGVIFIQGEADFATSGSGWASTVNTLATNLNTDLKAVTSQAANIPTFIVQNSNMSVSGSSPGIIMYPLLEQLSAHTSYPGVVILGGPTYAGETIGGSDLHYYGHQVARWAHSGLGNAMAAVCIRGETWNPVSVASISRVSNVVTVVFNVPTSPLVLDTTYVTNTADTFYGFDFHQTGGTTTLLSVAKTAANTLVFTLSGAPDGTVPKLRAGRNSSGAAAVAGPRTGARTCLRDSASSTAAYCNWCVHFDEPLANTAQKVAITIPTGATSATATIAAVDITKSAVFFEGFTTTDGSGTASDIIFPRVELTNPVTITAYRNTQSGTDTVTVYATVMEFTSVMVSKVRAGTITMSSAQTSNTATINSVDTSRSVALYLGFTTDYTSNTANSINAGVVLTNATTVTASRSQTNSAALTLGYMVVEFQAAVIQSVQPRAVTLTSTNSSDTDTITAVTPANTLLLYNGGTSLSSSFSNGQYRRTLTNATTVTLTRNGTNSSTRTIFYTALEFVAGILNSLQRSNIVTGVGVTSNTSTITSVNTIKSLVNFSGYQTSATTFSSQEAGMALTNATTVTLARTGSLLSVTADYEVAEFL